MNVKQVGHGLSPGREPKLHSDWACALHHVLEAKPKRMRSGCLKWMSLRTTTN